MQVKEGTSSPSSLPSNFHQDTDGHELPEPTRGGNPDQMSGAQNSPDQGSRIMAVQIAANPHTAINQPSTGLFAPTSSQSINRSVNPIDLSSFKADSQLNIQEATASLTTVRQEGRQVFEDFVGKVTEKFSEEDAEQEKNAILQIITSGPIEGLVDERLCNLKQLAQATDQCETPNDIVNVLKTLVGARSNLLVGHFTQTVLRDAELQTTDNYKAFKTEHDQTIALKKQLDLIFLDCVDQLIERAHSEFQRFQNVLSRNGVSESGIFGRAPNYYAHLGDPSNDSDDDSLSDLDTDHPLEVGFDRNALLEGRDVINSVKNFATTKYGLSDITQNESKLLVLCELIFAESGITDYVNTNFESLLNKLKKEASGGKAKNREYKHITPEVALENSVTKGIHSNKRLFREVSRIVKTAVDQLSDHSPLKTLVESLEPQKLDRLLIIAMDPDLRNKLSFHDSFCAVRSAITEKESHIHTLDSTISKPISEFYSDMHEKVKETIIDKKGMSKVAADMNKKNNGQIDKEAATNISPAGVADFPEYDDNSTKPVAEDWTIDDEKMETAAENVAAPSISRDETPTQHKKIDANPEDTIMSENTDTKTNRNDKPDEQNKNTKLTKAFNDAIREQRFDKAAEIVRNNSYYTRDALMTSARIGNESLAYALLTNQFVDQHVLDCISTAVQQYRASFIDNLLGEFEFYFDDTDALADHLQKELTKCKLSEGVDYYDRVISVLEDRLPSDPSKHFKK